MKFTPIRRKVVRPKRIKYVCATCGSDEVRCNADTAWSVEDQRWEIVSLFDDVTCEKCEGRCDIIEMKEPAP
jgi:DNA-directed RNA polymerase subunit RPC12/RpoP